MGSMIKKYQKIQTTVKYRENGLRPPHRTNTSYDEAKQILEGMTLERKEHTHKLKTHVVSSFLDQTRYPQI